MKSAVIILTIGFLASMVINYRMGQLLNRSEARYHINAIATVKVDLPEEYQDMSTNPLFPTSLQGYQNKHGTIYIQFKH